MNNRSVVVTGAGKGFGKSLVRFLSHNYRVIAVTRSASDIEEFEASEGANEKIDWVHADVADFADVQKKLERALDSPKQVLWGLINNAGVRCRSPFLDLDENSINDVITVNLIAPLILSQLVIPILIRNGGGRIINISSILSNSSQPDLSAYTISKSGLDGLTRSLAVEFGHRQITCNSVLPGFCETSYAESFKQKTALYESTLARTPSKRWGSESELNALCSLLLSDEGAFINGASIPIDGGWLAN